MSKKGLKSYKISRGPEYTSFPRAVFVLPLVVAACAALIIWLPHILNHNPADQTGRSESTKTLVTDANGLNDKNTSQQHATVPTSDTPTKISTAPNQSVSSGTSSSAPSTTQGSQPSVKLTSADCTALIKRLSDTLTGTKTAALSLLKYNLGMVGLDLGLQNNFIDGYNKNIKAAYDSSVKSAEDAGCSFTLPAPTPMAHKKLLD